MESVRVEQGRPSAGAAGGFFGFSAFVFCSRVVSVFFWEERADLVVTVASTGRRLVLLFVWFLCLASLVVVCLETFPQPVATVYLFESDYEPRPAFPPPPPPPKHEGLEVCHSHPWTQPPPPTPHPPKHEV